MEKQLYKSVHLLHGIDLLGSKMSLNSKTGNSLEHNEKGILATSSINGRQVLIPWANVKGAELVSAQPQVVTPRGPGRPKAV